MVDTITPRYTGCPRQGDPNPYLASDELVEAVNLTILLERRPLLIKGEPGSGKTQLAHAVARELGVTPYVWSIKSTSRARDGLYTYDALRRLQDVQMQRKDAQGQPLADSPANYIDYGILGRAFTDPGEKRPVVLIDEIDKADIDFPNDLLLELDEQVFEVTETGDRIVALKKPIVFITSNDEKELPEAFLRRCLFFFITFPDQKQLQDIVLAHLPAAPEELVAEAVTRFWDLRKQMTPDRMTGKLPSTSELLDWFEALLHDHSEDEIRASLKGQLLPFPEVLLKSWDHYKKYYLDVVTAMRTAAAQTGPDNPATPPVAAGGAA